jgi:hypothetical protein
MYEVTQEQSVSTVTKPSYPSNVYTVKYAVNITNSSIHEQNTGKSPAKERKPTEVVRLSPFKFRKKEEVIQDMVKNRFVSRESESIVMQGSS